MASNGKDLKRILALIDATPGFTWERAKGNHIHVDKDGRRVAVLPATPSDWRSMKNGVAILRRAGVNIPH